jgi:hypothetical protein
MRATIRSVVRGASWESANTGLTGAPVFIPSGRSRLTAVPLASRGWLYSVAMAEGVNGAPVITVWSDYI